MTVQAEASRQAIPLECSSSQEFAPLLESLACSLAISTFQAGKLIFISAKQGRAIQLPRNFRRPMGIAIHNGRMALALKEEVLVLVNDAELAAGYPRKRNVYDAMFAPRATYYTGESDIHDLAWGNRGLWAVNTRFSCLCLVDDTHSFVPQWFPPFVDALSPEDYCHLNGMALADGEPQYVTALGRSNTPKGWRPNKNTGGVLIDVATREIVLAGLPMPHSPRLIDGRLYMLLSATGELVEVDPVAGRYHVLCRLPGFVRGLAHCGEYIIVGLSRLRPDRTFGDLPIARQTLQCGVAIVHAPSAQVTATLYYTRGCEEIYDVKVLSGIRRPGIMNTETDNFRRSLSTPLGAFWSDDAATDPSEEQSSSVVHRYRHTRSNQGDRN